MKKILISVLILLLTATLFLPNTFAQEARPMVRLIYFRPSDRPVQPDIDAHLDSVIKDVQRFYTDQMEHHGYGPKTFQFEADANGTAVVHHVNGQFNDAYYQDALLSKVSEEILAQVNTERDLYLVALDSSQEYYCGVASGRMAFMRAPGDCVRPWVAAHELGHTFGLLHDGRDSDHVMYYHQAARPFDTKKLSDCTAEWLDVHRAFNPVQVATNEPTTIEMLPVSLEVAPITMRLHFEVTDSDGLHQAQLHADDSLIDYQPLSGNARSTVEFVTTLLSGKTSGVSLLVIDVHGNSSNRWFPIDITSVLPQPQVVTIPDANLEAAVREALELAPGTALTTHAMLRLTVLNAYNREIRDITGLEHAHSLRYLNIGAWWEADGVPVNSNDISDLTPLSGLTQLGSLVLAQYYIQFFTGNLDFLRQLPPLGPVSIPDPHLAAAIREELVLTPSEALTTHSILGLVVLEAPNAEIKDLTGLEHAVNLTELNLGSEYISGEGYVNSNGISDLSVLSHLTQLTSLRLGRETLSSADEISVFVSSLPPLKPVSIPDANLAVAVREALGLSSGESITTHSILGLVVLEAPNAEIKDLTGLEHAVNLTDLDLGREYISGEGYVNSNAISDWSPLAKLAKLQTLNLSRTPGLVDVSPLAILTQLPELYLYDTAVSDVAPLAKLTQLTSLGLNHTAVSDVAPLAKLTQLTFLALAGTAVSDVVPLANLTQLTVLELSNTAVSDVVPLANLTQLTLLNLNDTAVSDVSPLVGLDLQGTWYTSTGLWLQRCPLSYASIHTHIPAIQAKGIKVAFDNVAHPALLKTSGDRQEGAGGTALKNPFVVEAMDEHGKPIVGKPVLFEILAGGGTLSAQTATTDARGKAQITLTLGRAAGVNKVKVTAEGIESWVLFTAVATEAAPQLATDVNGDGVINLADLAIVAQALGKPVQNPRADVNGDGVVDGEDFALVAAALGESAAAAPSQAVLPADLTLEKVEWALDVLYAENTGSPAFQRGIAKLEGFLARLIPEETALLANYPNPFNPETWIPYQLATPAEVTVTIYAANGMVVRTLALGHHPAGSYESRSRAAHWDGRNALGERVASGVYFYTLQAGDFAATRKMLILK